MEIHKWCWHDVMRGYVCKCYARTRLIPSLDNALLWIRDAWTVAAADR